MRCLFFLEDFKGYLTSWRTGNITELYPKHVCPKSVSSLFRPGCHKLKVMWPFSHQLHVTSTSQPICSCWSKLGPEQQFSQLLPLFSKKQNCLRGKSGMCQILSLSLRRLFISLDFSGGRNSTPTMLGRRGMIDRLSGLRNIQKQPHWGTPGCPQTSLLSASFCVGLLLSCSGHGAMQWEEGVASP